MAWFSRACLPAFAPLTVLLLAAPACGPDAATTENPSSRTGGRGGANATTGGSGGSAATGTGGSAATGGGTGGTTGAGTGGSSAPGTGGTGGSAPVGNAIPLPMTVTANFDNQGWFGDPEVEKSFAGGSMTIRQVDGTTGPCAMRMAQARGKCLKVTYTPPPGLVPPAMGGWVGVFFLTTVLTDRSTAAMPAKVGDANWGVSGEPGKNIAPGATKISFQAAADVEGQTVTFKAGTAQDSFVVPDKAEVLSTSWKPYELSLAGASYGSNVFGAFAWILTDTTKPATFYLDNIVWE